MKSAEDDFIVLLAAITFVPILLAKLFSPVRDALVSWQILTAQNVLIPLGDGVGFDLARLLIVLCVVGLIITLIVLAVRRRALLKESGKK